MRREAAKYHSEIKKYLNCVGFSVWVRSSDACGVFCLVVFSKRCVSTSDSREGSLGLKQMSNCWNIPSSWYSGFKPTQDVNAKCRISVNAATKSTFDASGSFVTSCSKTSCCICESSTQCLVSLCSPQCEWNSVRESSVPLENQVNYGGRVLKLKEVIKMSLIQLSGHVSYLSNVK